MSKENKTKEEILDKSLDEMGEEYFPVFELSVHKEAVLNAMSEYAKIKSRERAIAFHKWMKDDNNFHNGVILVDFAPGYDAPKPTLEDHYQRFIQQTESNE
jgi:hypothetical protein